MTIEEIKQAIRQLTDDERLEIFEDYCRGCGRYDGDQLGGCRCDDDS